MHGHKTSKQTQLLHSFAPRHPAVLANKTILILPLTVWWPDHWSHSSIDHSEASAAKAYLLEKLLWYSCHDIAICSDLSKQWGDRTTTPRVLVLHKNSMEMKWPPTHCCSDSITSAADLLKSGSGLWQRWAEDEHEELSESASEMH